MPRTTGDLLAQLTRLFAALALVFVFMAPPVHTQTYRGYISGTVTDSDGAAITDVQVTAINQGTNSREARATSSVGTYRFVAVEPGIYTVEFTKMGFETKRIQDIQILASQEKTIDGSLALRNITTEISVTAIPGVALDKSSATIQQTFPGQTLDDIPMTTSDQLVSGARNFGRFAWLAPAVAHVPGQNETSANGHRGRENNYMIDGVDNNDNTAALPALFVPPEAIREFQVQVAPFSAEFGRNMGAQISVITKSGTNAYRGELWDFFRSSALEPLSLQSRRAGMKKTPRLLDHQFGADLGGPVFRDKTFFFGIFQGNLARQAMRTTGAVTIPTPTGYAALQSVPLRTGQTTASRQAVLQALSFLPEVYPQINQFNNPGPITINGVPVEVGSFVPVIPRNQNLWYFGGRIDHELSSKDRLSYRFHIDDRNKPLDGGNVAFGERWAADNKYLGQNHALSHARIMGSRFVNEARLAYTRLDPSFEERDPVSSTIRILSPAFTIGGLESFPNKRLEQSYQVQDVATFNASRHSLKFGIDLSRVRLAVDSAPNSKGTWTFQTLQDFLNSSPSGLTQLVMANTRYSFAQLRQSYFLQDDIKVTRKLTISAGLRYETSSVPLGYFGATSTEELNAMVPAPGKRDMNNWAPRVGFAYSPEFESGLLGKIFGEGRSSVRGGFGIAYDFLFYQMLGNPAVNYPRNLPNGSNLAAELVDAFPTLLAPRATTPTLTSALTFVNIPTDTQLPTTHFWSLSVQRQLHQNYVLELGYTGNRSYHLYRQSQTNPGILSSAKADAVRANCTFATLSSCQDPTGFPTSPSRVDPRWGIRILLEATGQAEYHAGYIRLDKKLSHGLQFGLNYTWSANLSDSEELFTAEPLITASSPATPQNFFDRRGEWSRSVFDRPHRLAFHYSYRVPGFTNAQAILRHALSGWQLAGFTEAQSGQPFTIRVGVDTLGNGQTGASQAGRPDYNPGGILILDPVTHDLRTFTIPLDGTGIVTAPSVVDPVTGARTFLKNSMPLGGTLGRNTFRGPGFFNTNWSLSKTFSLPRDTRLQIRGDFINVFNHDNFPNPDSNMTNAATRTFGTQTLAPLTDARQVLLGAKISF